MNASQGLREQAFAPHHNPQATGRVPWAPSLAADGCRCGSSKSDAAAGPALRYARILAPRSSAATVREEIMRRLVGIAAAAVIMFGASRVHADVVKVGLIVSYTGAFAMWGTQFQQAIEAYQAANGKTVRGPDGKEHEIQFVYRDAASAGPDKAKQLAEELVIREKVKFLAGFELSPHAMAVGETAGQAKIPVVIMNAATASITRGSPYYVRVSFTIPQFVVPAAQWAAKNGHKRIYTIVSDYAPGYDAETYFHKEFKANGGQIAGSARTPLRETNFGVYMEQVLQAKPDALYMFQPAGSPSIAFVKAFVERGLKAANVKLIGGGETQETFLPNFTDDIVGTITTSHYTPTNTYPENIKLKEQLRKLFADKAQIDAASAAAWDGTMVIYRAVAALGPDAEGLKYVDFIKGKTFDSPRGKIMIDPVERDVIQDIEVRRVEKVGGQLANVVIGKVPMVKDPWKIDNPPKGN
jgi:branched-chain amino acid transport system substrate-binding protein